MNSTMPKKKIIYYLIGIIILLLIFELFSLIINDDLIAPNIFKILKEVGIILISGDFYLRLLNTLIELFLSLLISILLGLSLGIISGINQNISFILKPIISFLRCIPIIIIIITSLIMCSNNKIIPYISTILILFPIIYESTLQGVISIDKYYIYVYKLNSKMNFYILRKVYLPLISSSLKSSLISSIGIGIKALITIEYICGIKNTIGNAIINNVVNINYTSIYAYTLILVIIIIGIESIFLKNKIV